jgi:8-oxo-dGTP pyrophosphatase MutT (NUDIX family)
LYVIYIGVIMAEDRRYTMVGKEVAWEGRFIRTVLLKYKDRRGADRKWEAVERINCNGIVAIIPVTAAGELLLIRQFRPTLDCFVREFPAGLNDRDEDLPSAAKRELVEETGHTSDDLSYLAEGPISIGLSTEMLTVYIAKNVRPAPLELRERYPMDETEDIELIKVQLASAYEAIEAYRKRGDLVDIKIYGFIELARQRVA